MFSNGSKFISIELRVSGFRENLTVNGKNEQTKELMFEIPSGNTEIGISFKTKPFFEKRPNGLNAVKCGALIFSVPIAYEKKMYEYESNGVERKFPYCDYELIPQGEGRYGYAEGELKVNEAHMEDILFSEDNPPITVEAKVQQIDWDYADGYDTVCADVPKSLNPESEK